jgi:protein SCO1/2
MNKLGLGLALLFVVAGVAILTVSKRQAPDVAAVADYGKVPDFSLTERSGRAVSLQDLRGKTWIADFIFTSCAGTCPAMTAEMRRLQDILPKEIELVSFSVDPGRDTPEVLSRYADKYGADPQRWLFLTGDAETLYNVSVKGFKLALDASQGSEAEPITHSSKFVLVDGSGKILGYYDGIEAADIARLTQDAKALL